MSRPLKILFLAANPKDTDRLRLDEEIRGIDQALRQAEFRDKFEISQQWAVRVADLQAHLLRNKPDIVHFSGHGSGASEIILEDGDGNSQTVPARALSQLFAVLKDNVRCVVLNACYSEQQAQAIAEHVDFVIGMSKAIGDEAAIGFAVAFYQALGYGKDVKTAFELGRVQIDLENLNEQDTPKLLDRSRDQKIFPDPSIFLSPPPPLSPPEAKDRANLLILLNKVKTFWIEGVLEKSVHNAVLLELGKEIRPQAVEHPWEMVLELPDQTNQLQPPNTKIVDIFEKMNRALLILGGPGSGKTITLLELARDLIIRAEADPTQPIPVVFNLSSWTDKRQPLHDWLVFELSTKYQIPKKIGRAWLKNNRILPLLDGLDEVKLENRAACVETINNFGETFGLPGCVVCCRIKEYTALTVRLKLNGAICLQPLTYAQVNDYLEASGSTLAALRSDLRKDDSLKELAQSPLMLSIMSLAYQDMPIEALTDQSHHRIADYPKHLFDAYINRMFARKGKANQLYTTEQTAGWLTWLAQNMRQHAQTIFLTEQLQPSWLSTRRQRLFYTLGSRLIDGLILGICLYLLLFVDWKLEPGPRRLPLNPPQTSTSSGIYLHFEPTIITLSLWIILGLSGGLIAGFIDALRFDGSSKSRKIKNSHFFWHVGINTFNFGLIGNLLGGPILAFSLGLSGGLSFGLIFGLRGKSRTVTSDIQTVENLSWSWAGAHNGVEKGSFRGVIFALILAPIFFVLSFFYLTKSEMLDKVIFLIIVMFAGGACGLLFGGLFGGIIGGISRSILETKTYPNQGIRLSIRNAILGGLIGGLIAGAIFGYIIGSIAGVRSGLFVGLLIGLCYGGLDVIQHYILRLILYRKKYMPWNYARFLDYATNLIFLQKVGGGYIFIHRLLLEHFAAMGDKKKSS